MDEMKASQPPARLQRYAAPRPKLTAPKSLSGDDVAMPRGPPTPATSRSHRTLRSSRGQAQQPDAAPGSAGSLAQLTRGRESLRNQNPVDLCLATLRHQLDVFSAHPDFPDDEEEHDEYTEACGQFMDRIETLLRGRQERVREEQSAT